jgi:hypothetical protein
MAALEGAVTAFQITKSPGGSIFTVLSRFDTVDEDLCALAGAALTFLDEA